MSELGFVTRQRARLLKAIYKKTGVWRFVDESGEWVVEPLDGTAPFVVTQLGNNGHWSHWCFSTSGRNGYSVQELRIIGVPKKYLGWL